MLEPKKTSVGLAGQKACHIGAGHRSHHDGNRRAVIAASIRIYALVARGLRLRRDGCRRKRRQIQGLVVADPYAGIGDEPASGGERVARAQRAVHREID